MVKSKDPRGIGRKGGFKSLGSNLPQNAYKGKVEKIREGLIHNAKVKRAYYRTLKREENAGTLPTVVFSDNEEELDAADLDTLHPSRSHAISQAQVSGDVGPLQHKLGAARNTRQLTTKEKFAIVEEKRREVERNQEERERKIKQRERKRRDLRKMTGKGQPVMKTRLEDLLGKVKQVMKK